MKVVTAVADGCFVVGCGGGGSGGGVVIVVAVAVVGLNAVSAGDGGGDGGGSDGVTVLPCTTDISLLLHCTHTRRAYEDISIDVGNIVCLVDACGERYCVDLPALDATRSCHCLWVRSVKRWKG